MAECIPNITLTDPQNHDAAPSPAQSPVKSSDSWHSGDLDSRVSGRPVTPGSSAGMSMGREECVARREADNGARQAELLTDLCKPLAVAE